MAAELVRLIARVPPELRDAVKVEAARSRRSVQSIVTEALEEWLGDAAPRRRGGTDPEALEADAQRPGGIW